MAKITYTTEIITGKVRLSYAHVWEPRTVNGGDEKYSCVILVPKSDKSTLNAIQSACNAAVSKGVEKFGPSFNSVNLKMPLRDGDAERPDDPVYRGCMFLNASSDAKRPPLIIDRHVQPILDRSEVYSGCYAYVKINFYPFNTRGNKGVAAGLNAIQKVADGESLVSNTTTEGFGEVADDDLAEMDSGYYAAPASEPAQPARPAINPLTGRPW